MTLLSRFGTALVGVTAVAVLAACTTDIPTTPTKTVTATLTESAPPPSPSSQGSSDDDSSRPVTGQAGQGSIDTATDGDAQCTPGAGPVAAAARDMLRIPAPRIENGWEATGSGGTWCGALSWVTLRSADGTGPVRPHQLLIYENGTFLGTGIRCNIRWGQEVVATTADAVTVRYLYPDPTNPAQLETQNPLGSATTTYRWNGSRIVMEKALPAVATRDNC